MKEHGASLIEALVVLLILSFVAVSTLAMYDETWRTFKRGENALEQQQSVRNGFDKMGLDLQMTGMNFNPNGDDTRPDEQIEAALDTAIVIRADFDGDGATASSTPESALAGGAFESVSIGNDEIVAYVLAKPDGSSTGTLTFEADVAEVARDGAVESVEIQNVALVHEDPPYTLYRITLNNDVSTFGGESFFVRTPLAVNIRSMSFRYLDQQGTQLNGTFDLSATADDIGGAESAASQRSAIRRVVLNLVGLTADPDLGWKDASDANPVTEAHRKFRLESDITLRNGGMVAVEDPPAF